MTFKDHLMPLIKNNTGLSTTYVFGVHKSGSTLLHKMVRDVCREANIPAINIPTEAFNSGFANKSWRTDSELVEVFKHPMLYYGFRFFPEVLETPELNIKSKKFVLLVRDPRDALVSQFYSYGGKHVSHKLPKNNEKAFLEKVQQTAHMDIDEYVVFASKTLIRRLSNYKRALNFDNGLVLKYEDIYHDKQTGLAQAFSHLGFELDEQLLAKVAETHDVRPKKEDPSRHIRKGEPGDHKNKLKPETTQQLNDTFREIAGWYGYTF